MADTKDIHQITAGDILTGRVTCLRGGSGLVDYHDDPTRELDVASPSSVPQWVALQGRYIHHGGVANSGGWEQ